MKELIGQPLKFCIDQIGEIGTQQGCACDGFEIRGRVFRLTSDHPQRLANASRNASVTPIRDVLPR